MSLLGLIEKRSTLANPSAFLMGVFGGGGATESGIQVNPQSALAHITVYGCVQVIAEAVGKLPLQLLQRMSNGDVHVVTDSPLANLAANEPNDEMGAHSFKATELGYALTWGNGYAEIERNNAGLPIALHPLAPNRIVPRRRTADPLTGKPDRRIEYAVTMAAVSSPYSLEYPEVATVIDRDDMLHFAGLGFDGIMGYSPVAMAREAIALGLAAQTYGARFFGNSGVPSGVLESPKSIKDPAKLREAWKKAHGGGGQRGTAVLEDGVTYKNIGLPPEDSQFIETRKLGRSDVCAIYRVPPHKVGDLDRSTNNNIEHQEMEFVNDCLMGWLVRIEQECTRKLLTPSQKLAGYFFAFDVDQILRGDMKSRYDAYAIGRNWSWLSSNDVRRKEKMNSLPGTQGDMYLVPMNMVPAERLAEEDELPVSAAKLATAATAIVLAVAAGTLPRDAGIGQLVLMFSLSPAEAEQIMGTAGTPAFQAAKPPAPAVKDPPADPGDGSGNPPTDPPVDPAADPAVNARAARQTFRAMLEVAATRSVHKETLAVRRAAKKPATFAREIKTFYAGHGDHMRAVITPVAATFAELLNVPFATARDAVDRLAQQTAARALTELADPKLDVETLMRAWDKDRPAAMADEILAAMNV